MVPYSMRASDGEASPEDAGVADELAAADAGVCGSLDSVERVDPRRLELDRRPLRDRFGVGGKRVEQDDVEAVAADLSTISATEPSSFRSEHWQMRKGNSSDASSTLPSRVTSSSRIRGGAKPMRPSRLSSNAVPVVGS